MNRVNSRAKGAAAEREAAAELTSITSLMWERTAQRWGNATPDVWVPDMDSLPIHVEVKHYAKGLARPTAWTAHGRIAGTKDGLWLCRLNLMHAYLGSNGGQKCFDNACTPPSTAVERNVHNLVSQFMAQAVKDAKSSHFPLVLMRENNASWIAVWRKEDDAGLAEVFLDYLLVLPDEE